MPIVGTLQAHEKISGALLKARAENRLGLVPFVTAGYPQKAGFAQTLRRIAEVADVVEVGVPFSDPMADGVTIQRASHSAISQGVTLGWILDELRHLGELAAPVVLMSYLNPLLSFGYGELAGAALEANVRGFIVPDLPLEESVDLRSALEARGLALIQLVTPATPEARMRRLCEASRGFVYAVTVTGITGGAGGLPPGLPAYLDRVRSCSSLPVCAGFGVREAAHARLLTPHVDGVIVGSALVEALEAGRDPAEFLLGLRPGA